MYESITTSHEKFQECHEKFFYLLNTIISRQIHFFDNDKLCFDLRFIAA